MITSSRHPAPAAGSCRDAWQWGKLCGVLNVENAFGQLAEPDTDDVGFGSIASFRARNRLDRFTPMNGHVRPWSARRRRAKGGLSNTGGNDLRHALETQLATYFIRTFFRTSAFAARARCFGVVAIAHELAQRPRRDLRGYQ